MDMRVSSLEYMSLLNTLVVYTKLWSTIKNQYNFILSLANMYCSCLLQVFTHSTHTTHAHIKKYFFLFQPVHTQVKEKTVKITSFPLFRYYWINFRFKNVINALYDIFILGIIIIIHRKFSFKIFTVTVEGKI